MANCGVPPEVFTVTASLKLTVKSKFSPWVYVSLAGTLTLETVGPTALEITLVVVSSVSSVPSLIVSVNEVVSETEALLSVGLNDRACNAVVIAAAVLLLIV